MRGIRSKSGSASASSAPATRPWTAPGQPGDNPAAKSASFTAAPLDQMPADREEVKCLLEEGIEVIELAKPQELHLDQGKLRGLRCRRMEYTGRARCLRPQDSHTKLPGSDAEFEVPLDTLILAISQHAILDFFDEEPVALNRRGLHRGRPGHFRNLAARSLRRRRRGPMTGLPLSWKRQPTARQSPAAFSSAIWVKWQACD